MSLFTLLIRLSVVFFFSTALLSSQTVAPLTITRPSGNTYEVMFPSRYLSRYQMQASPDLVSWVDLGAPITGGNPSTGNDSVKAILIGSNAPEMFYRLKEGAVRPGFNQYALAPNDDAFTPGPVPLGFTIKLFGVNRTACYVNNNGNITFQSGHDEFTAKPLRSLGWTLIAPYWSDVDTQPADPAKFSPILCKAVTYGQGTVDGRAAFGVNWMDVGYYYEKTDKLCGFQLVLVQRTEFPGNSFDIEFNYNYILWETGSFGTSGGVNGYGGYPARAGISNGGDRTLELLHSGETLKLLDANPSTGVKNTETGLAYRSRLSAKPGRMIFEVRNGNLLGALNVNAGPDRTLSPSITTITINGSASDPNGGAVTVLWTVDESSAPITFSNPTIAKPVVTMPAGTTATLRLTATSVTDPAVIAADTMEIRR